MLLKNLQKNITKAEKVISYSKEFKISFYKNQEKQINCKSPITMPPDLL